MWPLLSTVTAAPKRVLPKSKLLTSPLSSTSSWVGIGAHYPIIFEKFDDNAVHYKVGWHYNEPYRM